VLDWKFGQYVVPVEENDQLLFYGRAAILTLPQFAKCTTIDLCIIQPAATPVLRSWATTPDRLHGFETDLKIAVLEARTAENPTCRIGEHCRWCPLETICPEKQEIGRRAILDAAALEGNKAKGKTPLIDIADLVYWLDATPTIEGFLSAIREQALNLLVAGAKVPGYKLVDRQATRKWIDENEVIKYAKKVKLKVGDYMEPATLKSPAQFEKVLSKVAKIKVLPEFLTEKKSNGKTIAPTSDPRRDLNANDFSALKQFSEKK
jgi:Protein of unknown function (DUF2800)